MADNADGSERYARELRQIGVCAWSGEQTMFAGDEYVTDLGRLYKEGKFDLAVLFFWYTGEQNLPVLRSMSPDTRVVIDSIDLHFLRQARATFTAGTETFDETVPALGPAFANETLRELNSYAAADAVLTVSDKETALLGEFIAGRTRLFSLPLAEDGAASTAPFDQRRGILFVGNHRHLPNVEAVRFLRDEILPLLDPGLLEEHPVYIVGNEMHRLETERDWPRTMRLVGWVPSLEPYWRSARISVAPLLHGAGTKGKVIQSALAGVPSVSTTIGIEGLDLRDQQEVLVADDAKSFAAAITRLLNDRPLWERLAAAGPVRLASAHDLGAVQARFRDIVAEVMGEPAKGSERSRRAARARQRVQQADARRRVAERQRAPD